MSITITAATSRTIDYAALRATGHNAIISASACRTLACLLDIVSGITAYAVLEAEEAEDQLGSYVSSYGIANLPVATQNKILAVFADNTDAQALVQKAIDNRVMIGFRRDDRGSTYRAELECVDADYADLNLCGSNWAQFREAFGIVASQIDDHCDIGTVTIAAIENALSNPQNRQWLNDRYYGSVSRRLRGVIAYARQYENTELHWA